MGEEFKLRKRTTEELAEYLSTKVAILEVQMNDLQEAVTHLASILEDDDRLLQEIDKRTQGSILVGPGNRGFPPLRDRVQHDDDMFNLPSKEAMKRAVFRKDVEKNKE